MLTFRVARKQTTKENNKQQREAPVGARNQKKFCLVEKLDQGGRATLGENPIKATIYENRVQDGGRKTKKRPGKSGALPAIWQWNLSQ